MLARFATALLATMMFAMPALLVTPAALADGHAQHTKRAKYLERFYAAFAAQRAAQAAALLPQSLSWHMIGWNEEVVPFAGYYQGRAQLRELLADYFSEIAFRELRFEYQLTDGPYTTWHFRLLADVPATGKTFDAEFVHLWQFDAQERPTMVRAYYDTQLVTAAFEAAGPASLSDRKNASDDFRVSCVPYDIEALVTSVYDRFYAGDIEGVLAMLAPDPYVYFQGTDNPVSGAYHGLTGAVQFIQNLAGTTMPGEISRLYVSEGDRSDVVLFENWTVYATGKPFHVHTVNSWRANAEGQLMGFLNYPDVEAMAAAYAP